jgi:hypothetical protein
MGRTVADKRIKAVAKRTVWMRKEGWNMTNLLTERHPIFGDDADESGLIRQAAARYAGTPVAVPGTPIPPLPILS